MLREASDEVVAEEEAEGAWPEGSSRTADSGSCPSVPEVNEDSIRRGNSCANDPGGQPVPGGPTLVSSCSHALPPKAALPRLSLSLRAKLIRRLRERALRSTASALKRLNGPEILILHLAFIEEDK